jgi:hypothetical protein
MHSYESNNARRNNKTACSDEQGSGNIDLFSHERVWKSCERDDFYKKTLREKFSA